MNHESPGLSIYARNIRGLNEEKVDHIPKSDIIFLSETWLRNDDSIPIPGYSPTNFNVKNLHRNARRGCGGISVYIHDQIKNKCRILKGSENIVWLNIDSELDRPFAAGLIYFPPEGSTQIPPDADLFSQLESDIADYASSHHTIILGDLNAHTNNQADFIKKIDGAEFPEEILPNDEELNLDMIEKYHTNRNSRDTRPVNNYGKKLLDLCIASNHIILNGRLSGDLEGSFTRVENEAKGVLDYAISHLNSIPLIDSLKICKIDPDSDHCGMMLTLKSVCKKTFVHKTLEFR